jgi:hypothetical protein
MKQIKTFLQLRRYLQAIPYIDEGGCGIAALTMFRWLKQHQKPSEIVYFYNDRSKDSFQTNESVLKYGIFVGAVSCSHAYIRLEGKLYDTNGRQTDSRQHHTVTEALAVESIKNKVGWSSPFDRDFIQFIMEDTGVDLTDVKI